LVRASTLITHTDPKAEFGAFAVALAAQMGRRMDRVPGEDFLAQLRLERFQPGRIIDASPLTRSTALRGAAEASLP